MQDLTCAINGQYISFMIDIKKVVPITRGNFELISMRFTSPKMDNIERYYNDLEKVIKKLQDLI